MFSNTASHIITVCYRMHTI